MVALLKNPTVVKYCYRGGSLPMNFSKENGVMKWSMVSLCQCIVLNNLAKNKLKIFG